MTVTLGKLKIFKPVLSRWRVELITPAWRHSNKRMLDSRQRLLAMHNSKYCPTLYTFNKLKWVTCNKWLDFKIIFIRTENIGYGG